MKLSGHTTLIRCFLFILPKIKSNITKNFIYIYAIVTSTNNYARVVISRCNFSMGYMFIILYIIFW